MKRYQMNRKRLARNGKVLARERDEDYCPDCGALAEEEAKPKAGLLRFFRKKKLSVVARERSERQRYRESPEGKLLQGFYDRTLLDKITPSPFWAEMMKAGRSGRPLLRPPSVKTVSSPFGTPVTQLTPSLYGPKPKPIKGSPRIITFKAPNKATPSPTHGDT